MGNENISIQERTENFAIRVVKAYSELNKRHFADGRGLGGFPAARTRCYAQSNKDFIRLSIAATDFRKDTVCYGRNNDYANGQRNISDSAKLLDSNSWLAMPGKTLYEAGALKDTPSDINDERIRKQANDRFREVSRAIQAGHDEFVPQIQYGHEAVREAEQAATISGDGFKLTSAGLERANREAKDIQQQTDFNLDRVRRSLKKKRVKQLERFKTEINLVEYATSIGYKYLRNESSPSSAVLRHDLGDKMVVVTDTGDRGLYFSLKNNRDKGTIIDLVQRRRGLNLGEVRKELRPWLNQGDRDKSSIAKPEPTDRVEIDECLIKLKNLNQSEPQQPKSKPKQRKRRQLEL